MGKGKENPSNQEGLEKLLIMNPWMAISNHIKPIFVFYHHCQLRRQLVTN